MIQRNGFATVILCLIVVFPKEVEFAHASDESTRYHVLVYIFCTVFNKINFNYIHFCSVQQWAEKMAFELYNLGDYITQRKQVQEVSIFINNILIGQIVIFFYFRNSKKL